MTFTSSASAMAGSPKVLIADDAASMAHYAAAFDSLRIVTATTHYEAFEKFVREQPNVLVCDFLSENINSLALIQKIQQLGNSDVKIAILSDEPPEVIRQQFGGNGIEIWRKPLTPTQLKSKLAQLTQANIAPLSLPLSVLPLASAIISLASLEHVDVNDAYIALANVDPAELQKKKVTDLWRSPDFDLSQLINNVSRREKSYTLARARLSTKNGNNEFYQLTLQPLAASLLQPYMLLQLHPVESEVQERRRLEEKLQLLLRLANAVPQLVWIAEPTGNVIYYNDRVAEFSGAKKLADGKWTWVGMVHPADQASTNEAWLHAVNSGTEYVKEHRVQMRDGTYRWHLSRGLPAKDASGAVSHWYGTATDIHNLKEAENKAHENEQRFRSLAENSPDVITRHDKNFRYIYANRRITHYTGLDAADFVGKSYWELGLHTSLCHFFDEQLQRVFNMRQPTAVEYRMGGNVDKILHSRLVPEIGETGEVMSVIVLSTDITQQKTIEEELRRSESNFRTLTESLPQLIWTTNTKGDVEYFNQQWYEYTGSTPEESLLTAWTQYIHPYDADDLLASWRASLQTRQPIKAEFRLRGKDGNYKWFYVTGNPVFNQFGEVVKWVGTVSNINERREMQVQLENLVRKRTQELERSNQDLQQFAHVTSHDLKEPVRKIRIFANRLEERLGPALPGDADLYLQKIYKSTDRMNAMIEGILSYSIVNGTHEKIETVDLNQVLDEIKADLEVLIEQKEASLIVSPIPPIEGSKMLLYQLFYNLVNNALKFAQGGKKTTISVVGSRHTVDNAEEVRIMVRDNGIGFDAEFADTIFDAFTRLHSKDTYEGTGLGLALCKKIVLRHGGSIQASGVRSKGSTFTITLPVKQHKTDL